MAALPPVLAELAERLDARVVPMIFAGMSLRTGRVRAWLRSRNRPFVDPEVAVRPSAAEIEHTAGWVIEQAGSRAGAFGSMIGVAGALSVPTEVLGATVATVRLAQRLAVVYGFDIESDRGRMALWRALAAGYQVELPQHGPMGLRVTELPAVLGPGLVVRSAEGALAGAVVRQSIRMVGSQALRMVPLLSSGVAAASGRRRMGEIGGRMRSVLQAMADAPGVEAGEVEEAVEV